MAVIYILIGLVLIFPIFPYFIYVSVKYRVKKQSNKKYLENYHNNYYEMSTYNHHYEPY